MMSTKAVYAGLAVLLVSVGGNRLGWADTPLGVLEQQAMQAAVAAVAPSVVRIETFGGRERVDRMLVGTGPTTGLVVCEEGYVLSSAINFVQQPASILCVFPDGQRVAAEIVGRDRARMLVLLKIDADQDLPLVVPPVVARSQMQVGQWAIAVGRTFELEEPNVSVGVLSARDRIWGKAIQTDAKISPNNYGGPLIDLRGRVMGVLVPLSPQGQDEMAGAEWYDSGIGFAVPLADILPHLERLKRGEQLQPGVLGIHLKGQDIYALPAEIAAIQPKSPAADAGLQPGDVIVGADGEPIVRQSQLRHVLGRRYAGDALQMIVERDGQRLERTVQLVDRLEPYTHPFLGVLPERVPATPLVVRYVYPDSPAAESGLEPGDELLALAEQPVEDVAAALEVLANHEAGQPLAVRFGRNGQAEEHVVQLAALPPEIPEPLPSPRQDSPTEGDAEVPTGNLDLRLPEEPNACVAFVPETYRPDVPHGVVLWLTEPGRFNREQLFTLWQPLCEQHDLIVLAPQPRDPQRWHPDEIEFIGKALDDLSGRYRVDPQRIVAGGWQAGGGMAWLTALALRDRVRAVAAIDAALPLRVRIPPNEPLQRLAVHIAFARNSTLAERLRQDARRLGEMKYPVVLRELDEDQWQLNAEQTAELARWIDSLDRL